MAKQMLVPIKLNVTEAEAKRIVRILEGKLQPHPADDGILLAQKLRAQFGYVKPEGR